MDVVTYSLLLKKIKGLASGVQSVSIDGTTLNFVFNDGSTQTMTFPTPDDGKSLEFDWDGTKLGIRVEGDENFEYVDLKGDKGDKGEDGFSPTITENPDNDNTTYKLDITDSNGTFTTPNLMGQGSTIAGGSYVEISRAEYDALTDEERKDIVYFIYDDEEEPEIKYADERPTESGSVGDIVYNSAPQPNGWIGWVYTPMGWFGFGQIESSDDIPDNAFTLSNGDAFYLSDGTLFLCKETI